MLRRCYHPSGFIGFSRLWCIWTALVWREPERSVLHAELSRSVNVDHSAGLARLAIEHSEPAGDALCYQCTRSVTFRITGAINEQLTTKDH